MCFVFSTFLLMVFCFLHNHFIIPDSVANLKRENNALKAQLSTMTDEIAKLKDMIQQHGGSTTPASEGDSIQSVEFLSKEYDDLHHFKTMAKDELHRLNAKLAELKVKIDAIGNAIDEFQEYSFQYNVKIVGVPESSQNESAASTSELCATFFKQMGTVVSVVFRG